MGGIVGRELEQRQLLVSLNSARAGIAASIVLDGEAGIGKSTLLEWMCRNANGFTVLRVRGHEADAGSSYLVLRQLLKPILHHVPELDRHLAEALDSALRMSDAPTNESLVPLAVLELCSAATTVSPLLLALDDAHWFDMASLDALSFVARRVNSERVVVAFGLRTYELQTSAQLQDVPRLHLGGLDDTASRTLAEASGRQFSQRLREWSRGNPLALQHLDLTDGTDRGQIPDRLRRGFETELAQLPAATQRALAVAAIAGSAPGREHCTPIRSISGLRHTQRWRRLMGWVRGRGQLRLARCVWSATRTHSRSRWRTRSLSCRAGNAPLRSLWRVVSPTRKSPASCTSVSRQWTRTCNRSTESSTFGHARDLPYCATRRFPLDL